MPKYELSNVFSNEVRTNRFDRRNSADQEDDIMSLHLKLKNKSMPLSRYGSTKDKQRKMSHQSDFFVDFKDIKHKNNIPRY